jgi:hypothetical protein
MYLSGLSTRQGSMLFFFGRIKLRRRWVQARVGSKGDPFGAASGMIFDSFGCQVTCGVGVCLDVIQMAPPHLHGMAILDVFVSHHLHTALSRAEIATAPATVHVSITMRSTPTPLTPPVRTMARTAQARADPSRAQ